MSFSRARRFSYSEPSIGFSEISLRNHQNGFKDMNTACSDEGFDNKHVKTCKKVQCIKCVKIKFHSSYQKRSKMPSRQSTFVKDTSLDKSLSTTEISNAFTNENNSVMDNSIVNNSFSSSDLSFYDALSDISTCSAEKDQTKEHMNIDNIIIKESNKAAQVRKPGSDKNSDMQKIAKRTFTDIQDFYLKTVNHVRNETKKKLDVFLSDLNKKYVNFIEEMNQKLLNVMTNLTCLESKENGADNYNLENENKQLRSLNKKLSRQLQKVKENSDSMRKYYRDVLNRAEQTINDHELTIDTLKEELNALRLRRKLENILRS